jgi:hypothetical protein
MPIQFPTSPSVNQEYTYEGKVWAWDGSSWVGVRQETGIQKSNIWSKQNLLIPKRGFGLNSGYNGTTDQRRTRAGTIPALKHYIERDLGLFFTSSDEYYSFVTLLLHCDGANNSTTITDSSSSQVTVTAQGDAKISTAQSKFGGSSLLLDGTGDFGLIDTQMTNFEYSGDFTIEGWWRFNANNVGYQGLIGSAVGGDQTGWALITETNNTLNFYGSSTTAWNTIVTSTQVPTINTWHHIAVCRSGSTVRLFYNGTQIGSTTSSNFIRSGTSLRVGGYQFFPGGARSFNGYIDELRITKGFARYTANFTPPTQPTTP